MEGEPLPVTENGRSARLVAPQYTAPFTARLPISTLLKPPSLGEYIYWDNRPSGHRLDYRKRNASQPGGFDYLYLGWWSREDMAALLTQLSADDALRVLRVECKKNAELYLKKKKERDGN